MFTLLAEFARMERETLRERILSGMEEARRKGKHLGRPDGSSEDKEAFLKKYPSVVRNLRLGISARKTAWPTRPKFVIPPSIRCVKSKITFPDNLDNHEIQTPTGV